MQKTHPRIILIMNALKTNFLHLPIQQQLKTRPSGSVWVKPVMSWSQTSTLDGSVIVKKPNIASDLVIANVYEFSRNNEWEGSRTKIHLSTGFTLQEMILNENNS